MHVPNVIFGRAIHFPWFWTTQELFVDGDINLCSFKIYVDNRSDKLQTFRLVTNLSRQNRYVKSICKFNASDTFDNTFKRMKMEDGIDVF